MALFTQYPITQGFGPTDEPLDSGGINKGIDYATPIGTPIEALVGGTVVAAGDSGDGWGISVKVRDEQGNFHNYGHLSAADVRVGQQIAPGELLGASGNTGKSTGPHLSYDVWNAQGEFFDPTPFVSQQEGQGPMAPPNPNAVPEQALGGLLRQLGFTPQGDGSGANLLWKGKGPDGKDVTLRQVELANNLFGENSPYYQPKATTQGAAETQNVGGRVKQWNPATSRFDIDLGPVSGPTPTPADPQRGHTVTVGGRVKQWNTQTGQYDIDLGPSQTAPQPSIQVGRNGDVVRIDADGSARVVGNVPSLAQDPNLSTFTGANGNLWTFNPQTGAMVDSGTRVAFSPDEVRQQQVADRDKGFDFTAAQAAAARAHASGENAASRAYGTSERVAGQEFTAGENAASRAFSGQQSGIANALRASEFASTFGLDQQREKRAVTQANNDMNRQASQDALGAAEAYARQISLTDPAALPAFVMAGGGNIANAIHTGHTALSDNAVLPAARTLSTIEHPVRYSPFEFVPQEFNPTRFAASMFMPPPPPAAPPASAPPTGGAATTPAPVSAAPDNTPGFALGPSGQGVNLNAGEIAAGAQWQPTPTNPDGTFRFAFGTQGEPATDTFISGDSTHPADPAAGGARPELINLEDPPGPDNAQAHVTPLVPPQGDLESAKAAALFHAIGDFLGGASQLPPPPQLDAPRFAHGTGTSVSFATPESVNAGISLATPADAPYIDRVRALRTSVQEPQMFAGQVGDQSRNVGFSMLPSAIQQRIAATRQSKYGIPQSATFEEAQRYALQGVGRGQFNFGR